MKFYLFLKKQFFGITVALLMVLGFYAAPTHAQEITHQIGAGFAKGGYIDFGLGKSSSASSLVSFDYRLGLSDMFQIGSTLIWQHESGDDTVLFSVGPILNVGGPLNNSFFLGTQFGVIGGSGSSSTFAMVNVGKRFALNDHVSYEPSLQYIRHFGDNWSSGSNDLALNFIAFALTF